MDKAASLMFRALSMVGKFALLVYMAKEMALEDVGIYGLVTASVMWLVAVTGLDFHNYCLRELVSGKKQFDFVVSHQQRVFMINYGVLFLLCLLAGLYLNWALVFLILVLTILEHQGHEACVLAIAVRRPLLSAVLLFLRSGSWPLLAIAVMAVVEPARNVEFVIAAWMVASSLSLVLAYVYLYRGKSISFAMALDKRWVIAGLKTGMTYWVASLILRMTGVLDRYIMEARFGLDMVGVYSFYMAIGLSLVAFVESAILSFMIPDSVNAVSSGRYGALSKNQNRMLMSTLFLGTALSLLIVWAVPALLSFMGSQDYARHEAFLYLALVASMAHTLAAVPHFGLYSLRQDGKVLMANTIAFAVFVLALVVFRYLGSGVYTVIYAVLTSYLTLFGLKLGFYQLELNRARERPALSAAR